MMNEKIEAYPKKIGRLAFYVDILMIITVVVNLVYLVFDWSFTYAGFQSIVESFSEDFFVYYRDEIHPNFLYYESFFVMVFLIELLTQWAITIIRRKYSKWWFYPVIHWYDVLGCIPSGAFASLRLFRIIAMTYRLHKRGVVNLRKTEIYRQVNSVYEVFVHDAADRALIELVESARREVSSESEESALEYAIKPSQDQLAKAIAQNVHVVIEKNHDLYGEELKQQIEEVVKEGFKNSEEMKKVSGIPLVGSKITERLEKLVIDLSEQLADSLSDKLTSDELTQTIENIVNTSLDSTLSKKESAESSSESQLRSILAEIMGRTLDKIGKDIETKRKARFFFMSRSERSD